MASQWKRLHGLAWLAVPELVWNEEEWLSA